MKQVSGRLRWWFKVHFLVDYLFAIPLFFAPVWALGLLGVDVSDPLFVRLFAAALFGIGGVSMLVQKESLEVYRAMLKLKIIWSSAAIAAFVWAMFTNPPSLGLFLGFGAFTVFFFIWRYFYTITS
ncbi:MAG: hypothetical protein P8J32_05855 [bacterium]|jgi:hypothetical protein|nr:hypothetical protein [bacterium]